LLTPCFCWSSPRACWLLLRITKKNIHIHIYIHTYVCSHINALYKSPIYPDDFKGSRSNGPSCAQRLGGTSQRRRSVKRCKTCGATQLMRDQDIPFK
jgi:hypothetical protein